MAPSPSPPQRRLSLTEKLLSPQEGIPLPDFREPAQHPPAQSPPSARRPSLSERFFSRNGGAEYEDALVLDSPTSATTGVEAQAGDGVPRRRLSISERLFHRSPARHSTNRTTASIMATLGLILEPEAARAHGESPSARSSWHNVLGDISRDPATAGESNLDSWAVAGSRPSTTSAITLTSCVVLEGLINRFCGCLSTVSTFAVEVQGMQGRGRQGSRTWAYAIGSWAIGQLLMVAILGGTMWGAGVREANWCIGRLQDS